MTTAPNLTRVTRFGFVNVYLVGEEDGLTLVDTALTGSAKAILRSATGLGQPIVRIALTHAHADHVGSLDALAEALPGVEVSISARDALLLAKDKTPADGEPADAKLRGSFPGARRARRAYWRQGTASARSRWWRRPDTRPVTSRSSTPATAR